MLNSVPGPQRIFRLDTLTVAVVYCALTVLPEPYTVVVKIVSAIININMSEHNLICFLISDTSKQNICCTRSIDDN